MNGLTIKDFWSDLETLDRHVAEAMLEKWKEFVCLLPVGSCLECGDYFPIKGRGSRYKFCSVQHAKLWHKNKRVKEYRRKNESCLFCGDPLPLKKHKYCSHECKLASRRVDPKTCTRCGRPAGDHGRKYCATCRPIVQREQIVDWNEKRREQRAEARA